MSFSGLPPFPPKERAMQSRRDAERASVDADLQARVQLDQGDDGISEPPPGLLRRLLGARERQPSPGSSADAAKAGSDSSAAAAAADDAFEAERARRVADKRQ